MEAKIDFNDEQLDQVIQAAILSHISEKGRDKIIKEAITFLTTEREEYLSGSKFKSTPLMRAFYRAAHFIMEKIIQDEIKKEGSDFHKAVKTVVTAGVEKWIADSEKDVNQIAAKIAEAIEKAMTPSRYY